MCRWLLYLGPSIKLCDILTYPEHGWLMCLSFVGLLEQTINGATFLPSLVLETSRGRNHRINLDGLTSAMSTAGFGMGWYRSAGYRNHSYGKCGPNAENDSAVIAPKDNPDVSIAPDRVVDLELQRPCHYV